MIRKLAGGLLLVLGFVFFTFNVHAADLSSFSLRAMSPNEFQNFVDVFSEMRGPIRNQIMKDKKTDFENADPLRYVQDVKDERDVKKVLKKIGMDWNKFETLMGNVLLGYYSVQEESTKADLIKKLASYGLLTQVEGVPPEYQNMIQEVLKTDSGASVAAMALETFIQIPPENIALAKKNKSDLDRMFYTKYWKDKLNN